MTSIEVKEVVEHPIKLRGEQLIAHLSKVLGFCHCPKKNSKICRA